VAPYPREAGGHLIRGDAETIDAVGFDQFAGQREAQLVNRVRTSA
jgi:hypothetical protein